jgi:hypothetical protein
VESLLLEKSKRSFPMPSILFRTRKKKRNTNTFFHCWTFYLFDMLTKPPPFNYPSPKLLPSSVVFPVSSPNTRTQRNMKRKTTKRKRNFRLHGRRHRRSTYNTGPVRCPVIFRSRSMIPAARDLRRLTKQKGTTVDVTEPSDESRCHHCGAHGY